MDLADIFQLIISNGMGVGVGIYFLIKDWKQTEQRTAADIEKAKVDAAQVEVLRELTNTVNSLKDLITKVS